MTRPLEVDRFYRAAGDIRDSLLATIPRESLNINEGEGALADGTLFSRGPS